VWESTERASTIIAESHDKDKNFFRNAFQTYTHVYTCMLQDEHKISCLQAGDRMTNRSILELNWIRTNRIGWRETYRSETQTRGVDSPKTRGSWPPACTWRSCSKSSPLCPDQKRAREAKRRDSNHDLVDRAMRTASWHETSAAVGARERCADEP